jgi:8-oxo-dGTP pyrophosphatase MutT (NUDIX family)
MSWLSPLLVAGTRARRLLLRQLGASTLGVRGIALNGQGQVCLVRHSYRPGWFLPGGGVDAGETPEVAMVRELREEAGIIAEGPLDLFGIYHHVFMGADDYPIVYRVPRFRLVPARSAEIAEIAWAPIDRLPADMSPGSRLRLEELRGLRPRGFGWSD